MPIDYVLGKIEGFQLTHHYYYYYYYYYYYCYYYYFSIITQVIIEIIALSLAENGVIFLYNHLRRGDYSGRKREDKFSKLPPRALSMCLQRKLIK